LRCLAKNKNAKLKWGTVGDALIDHSINNLFFIQDLKDVYYTLILSSKPSFFPDLLCSLISEEFHFHVSEECCLAC